MSHLSQTFIYTVQVIININYQNIKFLCQKKKKISTYMDSGYWWVSKANMAVKEQRPAVKRMKNGNSFFG